MLTKIELERRRERSGRTVLALLCVSCQMKNVFGQLEHFCGAWEPPLLFSWHFSVECFWIVTYPKKSLQVRNAWCSDAFVSLLEEFKIVFFLCNGQDRVEKIIIVPPKTNLAGNHHGARLYFLLSSTFLWCCNFQISALERTLSGCLLSISVDFMPFPVKLFSARTGIQTYTCRCISPNDHNTPAYSGIPGDRLLFSSAAANIPKAISQKRPDGFNRWKFR